MKLFWREQIERWDIDTLKMRLRAKLGGYGVALGYSTIENLFYRGVIWQRRPDSIEQLSYPPAEKVTKLGRLNRIGQPMFYASRGAPAVFYEIHAKQGDCVALSTWRVVEPLWMHNLGFHEATLKRMGAPLEKSRDRWANPIKNETKFNEKLRRQLSEAFTEDVVDDQEYRYKLPIAINETLFDDAGPLLTDIPDGPRCDRAGGTVYPALRMRGAADNLAIRPEFVRRCLRLEAVSYVLVEASDVAKSSYTILSLERAIQFGEKEIIWGPGLTGERERRGHITFENGLWVLRDGLNQIFDVH
jgi:hypothetical protein